ncbi:hypothetical protein PGTUg99_005520 [Puccinia graminis f. sp. tritici]|uniref:Uncharacterized protein n=1 Tax=Puccinia graminis f. sp. tritici TaxID=56615 RepID=A0A5B0M9U7_PUCGR|nr:hypothetical protein PGTUg99_005520 [Puccinia graminis f. sp. tritici]
MGLHRSQSSRVVNPTPAHRSFMGSFKNQIHWMDQKNRCAVMSAKSPKALKLSFMGGHIRCTTSKCLRLIKHSGELSYKLIPASALSLTIRPAQTGCAVISAESPGRPLFVFHGRAYPLSHSKTLWPIFDDLISSNTRDFLFSLYFQDGRANQLKDPVAHLWRLDFIKHTGRLIDEIDEQTSSRVRGHIRRVTLKTLSCLSCAGISAEPLQDPVDHLWCLDFIKHTGRLSYEDFLFSLYFQDGRANQLKGARSYPLSHPEDIQLSFMRGHIR